MAGRGKAPMGDIATALFIGERAARVKTAARGRVDRAGNIPGQDDAAAETVFLGVWNWDSREQGFGIWVEWVLV